MPRQDKTTMKSDHPKRLKRRQQHWAVGRRKRYPIFVVVVYWLSSASTRLCHATTRLKVGRSRGIMVMSNSPPGALPYFQTLLLHQNVIRRTNPYPGQPQIIMQSRSRNPIDCIVEISQAKVGRGVFYCIPSSKQTGAGFLKRDVQNDFLSQFINWYTCTLAATTTVPLELSRTCMQEPSQEAGFS